MTTPISIWKIRERDGSVRTVPGKPEDRPYLPDDLPTYKRYSCIHSGNPEMEVRLRAASLEDSCAHMVVNPPRRATLDEIHTTGAINEEQARELRDFAANDGLDHYLVVETLLLLEAGGHVATDMAEKVEGD